MGMKLDEIEALLEAATTGPWIDPWEAEIDEDFEGIKSETGEIVLSVQWHDGDRLYLNHPNARLIAAAPTIIRDLVERVRKLEMVKEQAEEIVSWADGRAEYHGEVSVDAQLVANLDSAIAAAKEQDDDASWTA